MPHLIAIAFWIFAIWLIRRDTKKRDGISAMVWLPTLWAFIALSRPLSMWLGFGGGVDTMEGSPMDRIFYFAVIFFALVVLVKRRLNWGALFRDNWPIFLFYAYLLVSVLWAESAVVSFKRWFKDIGNVFVALVVLTEVNPQQAFRAVFIRCAYVLLPLSIIFIRYFPELGRFYSRSGRAEITGVAMQKNSLGALVLVCGLVLLWEWFERSREERRRLHRAERLMPVILFAIGAYLLYLCDSKTSIVCLLIGGVILLSIKLPLLRKRVQSMGAYVLAVIVALFVLESAIGIKEEFISSLGRDMTFTGRTEVWRELLALKTDPLFGTGFLSFWSDASYHARLPYWVGFSAHNGYLETYIDGGWFGVFFLILMLLVIGFRLNRGLRTGGNYGLLRFAIFLSIVVGSFSESHFARMGSLWFAFLLTSINAPARPVYRRLATLNSADAGNVSPGRFSTPAVHL